MDDHTIATIESALKMYVAINPVPVQSIMVGVIVPSATNFSAPKNFGISLSENKYETTITAPINPKAINALFVAFLSEIVFTNSRTKAATTEMPSKTYVQYRFVEIQVAMPGSEELASRLDNKEIIRNNEIPRITHNIIVVILANFIGPIIF